jgi:hypothetical protein
VPVPPGGTREVRAFLPLIPGVGVKGPTPFPLLPLGLTHEAQPRPQGLVRGVGKQARSLSGTLFSAPVEMGEALALGRLEFTQKTH